MSNYILSICIPTYNGEKYLSEAIESIVNQTFKDIEIIIVDDVSMDKTIEIAENYEKKYNNIKLYKNEQNMGLVGNWNKAVSYANGKYIKVMCQDDILEKECLKREVEVLEKNSEVVMVTAASNIINEAGEKVLIRKGIMKEGIYDGVEIIKKSLTKGRNIFGEPSIIMFRRKIIEKIGIYNEQFGYVPDWEYSIRMLMKGKLYYIDDILFSFRVSKTSETGRLFRKKIVKIIREEINFFNIYYKNSKLKLGIINKISHHINVVIRVIMKYIFIKFYI